MSSASDSIASEEAIVFGTNVTLVGIVTSSSSATPAAGRRGAVLLNAGVVHRVGPNRLYVELARRLSRSGYTVLRFDHSGIGDSPARNDHLSFDESSVAEAVDAMNWLAAERQCASFLLIGLCSGTLTAFRTALVDARVTSLVLLTALLVDPSTVPEDVVTEASQRRIARSYLVEKAASAGAWHRIVTGRVDYRRAWRAMTALAARRLRPPKASPADAKLIDQVGTLLRRGVSLQFIYAEPTTVLEWFRMTLEPGLPSLRRQGRIELSLLRHADHTFTERRHQARVIELIDHWVR